MTSTTKIVEDIFSNFWRNCQQYFSPSPSAISLPPIFFYNFADFFLIVAKFRKDPIFWAEIIAKLLLVKKKDKHEINTCLGRLQNLGLQM